MKYLNLNRKIHHRKKYHNENWGNCEEMWVKCYRIGLPLFLSETNNPAEIFHKQTKAFGKKSNGMVKFIKDNLGYFAYSKSDIGQKSFLFRTKTFAPNLRVRLKEIR